MKESINFDQILENNIGIGKYQLIVLFILSMIDIVSGIELILMSLSLPLIQIQWGISLNDVKNLVGIFYFGMIFGFLLTGNVSDKYGRRFTILIASIMQVLITIGFYFTTEFYSLLLLRGLLGFSFAFSLSLTSPMIAEITPLAQRGKSQILLNFSISLGKVFGCISAYIFISNDITQGNWQLMIITSSIFPFIVILGTILYIKESPRFLIINGQGKESIEIIQFMIKENNGVELSEDQINYLQTQNATQIDDIHINLTSLLRLFIGKQITLTPAPTPTPIQNSLKLIYSEQIRRVTIRLWTIWFMMNFINFAQMTILPYIIGKQKQSLNKIAIAVFGEIPAIFFSLILVDAKYMGRKNSLTLFFILQAIVCTIIYCNNGQDIVFYLFIARFFVKNSFAMMYPLTTEIYPTEYRTIGYGWTNAVGNMGGSLMPYIIFPALNYETFLPFLILTFAALIGSYASYTLPYDTARKNLQELSDLTHKSLSKYKDYEMKLLIFSK